MIWTWKVTATDLTAHDRGDIAIFKAFHAFHQDRKALPTLTRSQLKRLIEEGHVTADGIPIKATSKFKPGTLIAIHFPAPQTMDLVAQDRPLEILFEDEHILVVNKPPQLTVHPSPTQMENTLVHALLHHIKNLSGIGGVLRPGIVHRIDKNTSGALVITKTDAAHVKLAEVFAKHQIERSYWALCYGSPSAADGKIDTLIGRNPADRKKMSSTVRSGKKAVSQFRTIQEFSLPGKKPFASWLEVTLETGRTHQVRVHLTSIGHSILGDPLYGTPSEKQAKWMAIPREVQDQIRTLPGQALHARILGFQHPVSGVNLRFEAKPPPAFQNVLQALDRFRG